MHKDDKDGNVSTISCSLNRTSGAGWVQGVPCDLLHGETLRTDRQTDRTENITFPQIMYAGGNENWALNIQVTLV